MVIPEHPERFMRRRSIFLLYRKSGGCGKHRWGQLAFFLVITRLMTCSGQDCLYDLTLSVDL